MRETRARDLQGSDSSAGAVGAPPHDQSVDDWLGDVSDEDWNENAAELAERRRAAAVYEDVPAGDRWREPTSAPPREFEATEPQRADFQRRRLLAGLAVVAVLGLAVVIPALLLRGGGDETVTPVVEPTTTPPAPAESSPSPPPATTPPPPSPSATTPATTPDTAAFTLPEGTKLRVDEEADPAVVTELQQALATAGYDPGPVDGTYGQKTEAAVVAFQQDNGLSADGVVGPETAAALNGSTSTSATPETTPSTTPGFTLPKGAKLRRGEGDPAVVTDLQQALSSAGYDPGTADGTFGEETEAAVVAFQQDNGLSADGVVGTETAAALNGALVG